ncbi:MAG: DUF1800 family protein [Ilumatobacter sp.]
MTLANPTRAEAVRFLQRATFGATSTDVNRLMNIGAQAWLDEQMRRTPAQTWHARRRRGDRLHDIVWQSYLTDADQLRKRVAYALSQIMVASSKELNDNDVAVYADLLEAHCFGTYRELLEAVTRSVAMGDYLTYDRNRREDERRGSVPDENYAREVLQLFSIGLWELNRNGTQRTSGGQPIPTFDDDDVVGLARVFTGFRRPDVRGAPNKYRLPMESTGEFAERWHETGAKQFFGATIPAREDRTLDQSLALALDAIAGHHNVAPFISRQLIQRLVTSNPSPAYVDRVAAVFDNDGNGRRGNLGAVVRAILTDAEAWRTSWPESHGKVREPVLRFTIGLRAFGARTTSLPWQIGRLDSSADRLGQQPFDANSVFNFYRPGYVPPQSPLGDAGLVAPEMQIANETSAIGWINYLARFLRRPPNRVRFEIDDLLAAAVGKDLSDADAAALVDEIAARLCPTGLSDATRSVVIRRVQQTRDDGYDPDDRRDGPTRRRREIHLDRVMGAASMILASTDFLWER